MTVARTGKRMLRTGPAQFPLTGDADAGTVIGAVCIWSLTEGALGAPDFAVPDVPDFAAPVGRLGHHLGSQSAYQPHSAQECLQLQRSLSVAAMTEPAVSIVRYQPLEGSVATRFQAPRCVEKTCPTSCLPLVYWSI